MAKIGIVQYKSSFKGGAESVCMHIISALANDHELTFFTPVTDTIDFDELAEFYDLSFDGSITVEYFKSQQVLDAILKTIGETNPESLKQKCCYAIKAIKQAFYLRGVKNLTSNFDLIIWASRGPDIGFVYQHKQYFSYDEFDGNDGLEIIQSDTKSIRYIHCPFYIKHINNSDSYSNVKKVISNICDIIVGSTPPNEPCDKYIVNSNWTAELMKSQDVKSEVIHPPVNVTEFKAQRKPWEKRDNGFVCIGRLAKDKNILQNIEVIDQLRQRNHDVHLHIIGIQTNQDYFEEIAKQVRNRDYVILEGEVSKSRLIDLVCSHKFGIHGKEHERFGIVVAEMVSGGAIPFIPNSGGQREIVNFDDNLIFDDVDGAITKINRVLNDPKLQDEIQTSLTNKIDTFDRTRFISEIKELVGESLADVDP